MSAAIFAKLSAELHRHPKARRAGYHGTNVFRVVLELNALHGATGRIPASHSEAFYLADALMCSEAEAAAGLEAAVRAKLLEVAPDGAISIVGWDDDEWGRGARLKAPDTHAERQARYKAKLRATSQVTRGDAAGDVERRQGDEVTRGDDRVRVRDQSSETDPDSSLSRAAPAGARDRSAPEPHTAVVAIQQPLGHMVEHAVQRLDAARVAMDPTAKRIGTGFTLSSVDRDKLLAALRRVDERERRETLDHCLDVLIAVAKERGNVGLLRVGMLAGESSWDRWRLGTVASVSGPRDGPRSGGGGGPRRGGGGGALTGLDALMAQVAEEQRR